MSIPSLIFCNTLTRYTNRASVYTTRKEYDLALADLQHAAELSPTSARVYTGIGNALLSLKRNEDALAAFNQAIALDPNENGALGALGGWAAKESRLKEAETCVLYFPHGFGLTLGADSTGARLTQMAAWQRGTSISPCCSTT